MERAHREPDVERLRAKRTPAVCVGSARKGKLMITVSVWERPRGVRSCTRSEDYSGPSPRSDPPPAGGAPLRYGRSDMDRCSTGSTRCAARRGHVARRTARDPRAGRFGQDARAHASHRVPRARRLRRGAPRARGHVHPQGRRRARRPARMRSASTGVTAGTFHALALAQLRRRALEQRPRGTHACSTVEGAHARRRSLGRRGAGRGRGSLADLAAEIEWAKAAHRPARAVRGRGRAAGRRPPRPRPRSPTSTPATKPRSGKRRATTSTTSSAGAPTRSSATRRSRPRSAGGSATCSSTSSRTRRRCSSACCGPGSAIAPTSVSSATRRRRSTGSPAPTRRRSPTSRDHFPGGTVDRARPQLPIDARRSSPSRKSCSAGRRASNGRRVARGPADGRGTDRRARTPTTTPKPPRSPRDAGRRSSTACRGTTIGVLFRTNAQSSLFEAAFTPARRPVPVAERRALRRTSGRAARCSTSCGRPSAPAPGRPFSEHLADLASAGDRASPTRAEPPKARLRTRRARRAREQHAHAPCSVRWAASTCRPTAARPRRRVRRVARPRDARRTRPRAPASTRDVPPGQRPRVAGRVRHRARAGLVPISWATAPAEQLAEERRLLHVALGRAEDELHCSWAGKSGRPTAPAAMPVRPAPGSSTWSSGPRPGRRRRSTPAPRLAACGPRCRGAAPTTGARRGPAPVDGPARRGDHGAPRTRRSRWPARRCRCSPPTTVGRIRTPSTRGTTSTTTSHTPTIMALALLLVTIATTASWALLRLDHGLHGNEQH